MAWRTLALSKGAFLVLNIKKARPKDCLASNLALLSKVFWFTAGTLSIAITVPELIAVTRAVSSTKMSQCIFGVLAGCLPL